MEETSNLDDNVDTATRNEDTDMKNEIETDSKNEKQDIATKTDVVVVSSNDTKVIK